MSAADVRCPVFLLAQNRLLREALAHILEGKPDLRVVGSSGFSSDSIEQVEAASPEVVLMDFLSAEDSSSDFMRDLSQRLPAVKIMMISMDLDRQTFLQTVRAGAIGYVLKDASSLEVISAIRAVARGEAVCPNELCSVLFEYVARQSSALPSFRIKMNLGLTGREQQLLQLISRGMTNKEIACELNLAEQTVRNHVHRVLRKMGTHDRFAAVEICRIQGLAV
jgi:DNA-binding NarL/FixJ family response regulator